jgi:hypothetical protein
MPNALALTEIGRRIALHLRRLERDEWNRTELVSGAHLHCPSAYRGSRYVRVRYRCFQAATSLNRQQATDYLAWLDAGNKGTHFDMNRDSEAK